MDTTPGDAIAGLLRDLSSGDAILAWREFLIAYGPVLQQVVRLQESDVDTAADCFLFVCEHLARDRFRRLRQFRPGGPASFPTWLRSVARNLCIDWHRKTHGRVRDGAYPAKVRMETLAVDDIAERLRDPHPDPETLAAGLQRNAALQAIVSRLSPAEQLLIRLRFEQELTLEQIARLSGLKDAQTVDRRLRQILEGMRQNFAAPRGKFRPSSV